MDNELTLAPEDLSTLVADIQRWNKKSHIQLTEVSGHLWLAIAHLEQYKQEMPDCIEKHQIIVALSHAKKSLVAYSLTRHSQDDPIAAAALVETS